ncbi:23S rRNA (adenine2503-C2)-methyltransferase [Nitratiruptor sp. YY08-26]|uniref:23S rRNA (adenine(2503)-C(2))-methyltransferase RlmN n=1 Tax=unclassified Nitratiruptor TaxID=2624044 RepID=UPI001915A72A|nr:MULTISPECIES: 23S rRNA (adenine(2503)-C(2))-methyltransferase RlmN [unclassified Nitratiruptor]BCD61210.1 23S rRNA (adenine2503-C2)-methyltransferase [Nitratiruptor sp. YY08-13]BCD65143.1 23S rRNA (adenine2503-C2)-methyltransferase [Nitratiruptor sp. YY08-26]
MKKNILDLTKEELQQEVTPKFRANQIFQWLYQKGAKDFEEMSNLPKSMRQELKETFTITPPKILNVEISKDGSKKYLLGLHDGHTIESVLLPMKKEERNEKGDIVKEARYTICVSSQVGCKVGCEFCLTAKGGFVRNLSPGEIVGQVLTIREDNNIPANRRVNIVYMGMGEPLDNLENVAKAVKIFSDEHGMSISPRRQTISTSGLAPKIKKLGKMNLGVLLAISLHAVDDELRQKLMPINKAYNIESVIEAVKEFPIDQRKRVMFEYLMIKDLNDDLKAAKKLVKLLHGIKAKVNLIYFNPYPGSPFQRPEPKDVETFQHYLLDHGVLCTIRESKGLDISAACGQLKEKSHGCTL